MKLNSVFKGLAQVDDKSSCFVNAVPKMHSQHKTEMQMVPIDDNIHLRSEEETSTTSSPHRRKNHVFDLGQLTHVSEILTPPRRTSNRLIHNLETVILGAKINVLLPFGPLAVIFHYATNKRVRHHDSFLYRFITVLGIASKT